MQLTSNSRAKALSTALFFIGLALLAVLNTWWPAIMLVIGIPLAFRQCLLGRYHDMILSLLVFGGVFVTYQSDIDWQLLLPVIFVIAALYVLFREFTRPKSTAEEEEDLNTEIEEDENQ